MNIVISNCTSTQVNLLTTVLLAETERLKVTVDIFSHNIDQDEESARSISINIPINSHNITCPPKQSSRILNQKLYYDLIDDNDTHCVKMELPPGTWIIEHVSITGTKKNPDLQKTVLLIKP